MKRLAVIVDVDGTLAHMSGRISRWGIKAPYIDDDAQDDNVDSHIVQLVRILSEYSKIIICSGRKESSRPVLVKWLELNDIPYSKLYMRDSDDQRKDSIVKREIYEKHISGKYNVWLVLDDRDQVVKMWREELGLKCLQTAEGNF